MQCRFSMTMQQCFRRISNRLGVMLWSPNGFQSLIIVTMLLLSVWICVILLSVILLNNFFVWPLKVNRNVVITFKNLIQVDQITTSSIRYCSIYSSCRTQWSSLVWPDHFSPYSNLATRDYQWFCNLKLTYNTAKCIVYMWPDLTKPGFHAHPFLQLHSAVT